jgi:superfamily I DNA/RNA helicase
VHHLQLLLEASGMFGALKATAAQGQQPKQLSAMFEVEIDDDTSDDEAATPARSKRHSPLKSSSSSRSVSLEPEQRDARKRIRSLNVVLHLARKVESYSTALDGMAEANVSNSDTESMDSSIEEGAEAAAPDRMLQAVDSTARGIAADAASSSSASVRSSSTVQQPEQQQQQQQCGIRLLRSFNDYCTLLSEEDDQQPMDRTQFMSMHASKGKEFACVALPHLYEGSLPAIRGPADETLSAISQERNVLYVAATRAKDHLMMTWPQQVGLPGGRGVEPVNLSRFLHNIVRKAEAGQLPGTRYDSLP